MNIQEYIKLVLDRNKPKQVKPKKGGKK